MKKRSIRILIAIGALLAIYIAGVLYFNNTVIPNTKMYGEKMQSLNTSSIKKALDNKNIDLVVKDSRKKLTIPMNSLEYKIGDINTIKKNIIEKQNSFMWPIIIISGQNYNVAQIKVTNKDISNWIKKNEVVQNKGLKESKDAIFDIDENTGEVSVINEIIGEQLDDIKVQEEILKSLASGNLTIDLNNSLIMPNATGSNLRKTLDEVKYKISNEINVKVEGKDKSIAPTKKEKLKWLNIDYKKNTVNVEKKAILNYLKTINQSFVKSAGGSDTIYSIKNGQSTLVKQGIAVSGVDEYALTAKIYDAMENNYELKDSVKAITISKPKASYQGHSSIDNNFVEVSIAKQKVYLYTDGKLVMSADVVTGKPGGGTDTTKGSYTIMYKATNFTLKGDAYGYDYKLPVSYWLPFEGGGGIGLHDAPWRSAGDFGGSLYLSSGSHGCINMQLKDVRVIYNTIVAGTGVWVH